jgi:hypothetical protein
MSQLSLSSLHDVHNLKKCFCQTSKWAYLNIVAYKPKDLGGFVLISEEVHVDILKVHTYYYLMTTNIYLSKSEFSDSRLGEHTQQGQQNLNLWSLPNRMSKDCQLMES